MMASRRRLLRLFFLDAVTAGGWLVWLICRVRPWHARLLLHQELFSVW